MLNHVSGSTESLYFSRMLRGTSNCDAIKHRHPGPVVSPFPDVTPNTRRYPIFAMWYPLTNSALQPRYHGRSDHIAHMCKSKRQGVQTDLFNVLHQVYTRYQQCASSCKTMVGPRKTPQTCATRPVKQSDGTYYGSLHRSPMATTYRRSV